MADSTETAYLLDLLKYLHKRIVLPPNSPSPLPSFFLRSHASSAPSTPDDISFGSIPQALLDAPSERIFAALENNPELASLHRSMTNAAGLYIKTRPTATKESADEAKTVPRDVVHPLFAAMVDQSEEQRTDLVAQIRQFKPNATVFEFQAKNKDERVQAAVATMVKKRQVHSATIARHHAHREAQAPVAAFPLKPTQAGELADDSEDETRSARPMPEPKASAFRDDKFYIAHQRSDAHVEKEYALALRER